MNVGGTIGSDLERTLHVRGPLRAGQADLLLRRPDAPKRFRCYFHAALPLDRARQRAGLVVAAAPAAPPVQRQCSVTFALKILNNSSLCPTVCPTCVFRDRSGMTGLNHLAIGPG